MLLTFSVACVKTPDDFTPKNQPKETSFENVKIPEDFCWDLHKNVAVTAKVLENKVNSYDFIIEIYEGDNILLDKGYANKEEPFISNVTVKKNITSLRIVRKDIYGACIVKECEINGNKIETTIDESTIESNILVKTRSSYPTKALSIPNDALAIPESGILTSGNKYKVEENQTIENASLVDNIELYVEGTFYILRDKSEARNVKFYIGERGIITTKQGAYTTTKLIDSYIENYGHIATRGGFHLANSTFDNHYTTFFDGYTTIESSTVNNYYKFYCNNNTEINNNSIINNDASFITRFEQKCYDSEIITIKGAMQQSEGAIFENSKLKYYSGAKITVGARHFTLTNTEIINPDNTSYCAILSGKFTTNAKDKVNGKVFIYTTDNWSSWGEYQEPVIVDKENPGSAAVRIAPTEFNENGYNSDGWEKPGPGIEYSDRLHTVAIEDNIDLAAADMDMNDIVCEWQFGTQRSYFNTIDKIGLKFKIKAVGAKNQVAGAIKLNGLEPEQIKSVSFSKTHNFSRYFTQAANGIEANNTDVVVPLFENAHSLFNNITTEFINTEHYTEDPYVFYVEIALAEMIPASRITPSIINFFIVTDGDQNSRTELHLFGNKATSKQSKDIDFTISNQVWGMQFTDNFRYPIEHIGIDKAYPEFLLWAQSGGKKYQNWYENPAANKVINFK